MKTHINKSETNATCLWLGKWAYCQTLIMIYDNNKNDNEKKNNNNDDDGNADLYRLAEQL